jgi:hypothetical protein
MGEAASFIHIEADCLPWKTIRLYAGGFGAKTAGYGISHFLRELNH